MTRRVVVVRDTCSPLWVLRCPEPCAASPEGRWCQPAVPSWHGRPADATRTLCWLGSSRTEDGARVLAETLGWEVVG